MVRGTRFPGPGRATGPAVGGQIKIAVEFTIKADIVVAITLVAEPDRLAMVQL